MTDTNKPKNNFHLVAKGEYEIRKGNSVETNLIDIGVSFLHKDGIGQTIILNALPAGNKIVLLPPKDPKENDQASTEQQTEV